MADPWLDVICRKALRFCGDNTANLFLGANLSLLFSLSIFLTEVHWSMSAFAVVSLLQPSRIKAGCYGCLAIPALMASVTIIMTTRAGTPNGSYNICSFLIAPDPNTSAKLQWYKWELHRDAHGLQEEGMLLQKYGEVYREAFTSLAVRAQCGSPYIYIYIFLQKNKSGEFWSHAEWGGPSSIICQKRNGGFLMLMISLLLSHNAPDFQDKISGERPFGIMIARANLLTMNRSVQPSKPSHANLTLQGRWLCQWAWWEGNGCTFGMPWRTRVWELYSPWGQ